MPLPAKADSILIPLEKNEPLKQECQHFIDCIKNNTTPRTDGKEGLRVKKVLQKASEKLANNQDKKLEMPTHQQSRFPEVEIHGSAIVDHYVEYGAGSTISHFSHISPGTNIGEHVS